VEQLVELGRGHPEHGGFLVDESFLLHIYRDLDGRTGGPLAAAGLQHVEFPFFNGELDVLHILVMLLQGGADSGELAVALGQHLFHGRQIPSFFLVEIDRLGSADAGYYILALGIDKVFAVKVVFTGGRVAGKGHAGGTVVAHVAEDHGLHVDGGPPVGRNIVQFAVGNGALVHPRAEDGADGSPELCLRIFREVPTEIFPDGRLEGGNQFPPVGSGQLRIEMHAARFLFLLQQVLQHMLVHPHDDIGVHLHEAAVGVVGKTFVTAGGNDPLDRLVVEAEIEDGIHHSRHGGAGSGADRDQQGVDRVAESTSHQFFHCGKIAVNLVLQGRGVGFGVGVVVSADFGGKGETRRDRQADTGHFSQIRPLAAEKVFHCCIAFSSAVTEIIDILCCHCALLG